MKIKSILFPVFFLCSIATYAQNNNQLQQFEQELKSKNTSVTSIECNFSQIIEMAVLKNTIHKTGKFYYQRPGKMLLSFDDGNYIKMTEEWFAMKNASNTNTTKVSANPMLRNLNRILSACVVGDFVQATKDFDVDVKSVDPEWIVAMSPKHGKSASKLAQIVVQFNKKDMSIYILKMVEKSGNYTMYKFTDKIFNVDMDNELFNISK